MRKKIPPSFSIRCSVSTVLALGALGMGLACSSSPDDATDDSAPLAGASVGGAAAGAPPAVAGAATFGGNPSGGTAGTPAGGTSPGGQAGAAVGGSSAGSGGTAVAGSGGAGSGGLAAAGAGGSSAGAGGSSTAGASGAAGATAGSAGMTGTAGSGSTGFDPCPPAGMPCKILPLGDSITDGVGVSGGGGYRIELFRLARADNKSITYLGGSMNGPMMVDGVPFPRNHEGHSGWTIQQIDGIVPSPALNTTPHIVLLHIGTNDMYQMPNGAADRLGPLLDQIITAAPDALLVVSTIIPFPQAASQVMTYNNAVPGVVDARAKAGKHVVLVDQFKGFPTSELADGVHPNTAGYARMAKVWYEAIKPYLR